MNSATPPASPAAPRPWQNVKAFGPGLVHWLGSMGPNDLIINSVAGATYGYSLLWFVALAYALNYFIAEAYSRYVIASGESIMEGYGRLGRPVVALIAIAIFLRRHLNNLVMVLLLGASVHLLAPLPFERSRPIWSLICFALAFTLMYRGGYRGVERVGRVLIAILGGSLALVAALARPDATAALRGLLIPSLPDQQGVYGIYFVLAAIAGSSLGSINHLKYPAFVYEKGWRSLAEARKQRVDLVLSVTGQFLIAATIQLAAAGALYGEEAQIRTVEDLSRVFSGPLGEAGRILIGTGMCVTVFSSYVNSNTGYSLIVADTFERFYHRFRQTDLEAREATRRRAFRVLVTFFCFSPLYVLLTSWEPVRLALFTSALFVVLTPLLLAGIFRLTTNPALMKESTGGPGSRIGLSAAIAVACYLTWRNAVELIARMSE